MYVFLYVCYQAASSSTFGMNTIFSFFRFLVKTRTELSDCQCKLKCFRCRQRTDRQNDRLTGRQRGGQTDRERESKRETDRQTDQSLYSAKCFCYQIEFYCPNCLQCPERGHDIYIDGGRRREQDVRIVRMRISLIMK